MAGGDIPPGCAHRADRSCRRRPRAARRRASRDRSGAPRSARRPRRARRRAAATAGGADRRRAPPSCCVRAPARRAASACVPPSQRHDLVRHPGVDQRLRADDAAGAAGAGDDDQRVADRAPDRRSGSTSSAPGQVTAPGTWKRLNSSTVRLSRILSVLAVAAAVASSSAAVTCGVWLLDLDDLGKGLARHVVAREQRIARPPTRPRRRRSRTCTAL